MYILFVRLLRRALRVGDASVACVRHVFDVLVQRALRHLERRRDPRLPPRSELLFRDVQLDRVRHRVHRDNVPVAHERDWSADLCLWYDVPNAEAV